MELQANRGVCRWEASRQTVVNKGPSGAVTQKQAKRRNSPRLEWLENRLLLTRRQGTRTGCRPRPTSADVQHGPMANMGRDLINVTRVFITRTADASRLPAEYPLLQVPEQLGHHRVETADTNFQSLQDRGAPTWACRSSIPARRYGLVDGWHADQRGCSRPPRLPQTPQRPPDLQACDVRGCRESTRPTLSTVSPTSPASTQGVDGTGVTVGVLSDSFRQPRTAMQLTSQTGDLPIHRSSRPGPPRWRCGRRPRRCSEHLRHRARRQPCLRHSRHQRPGASANNILALASTAGAKIIVDDVGYPDEPLFQPGFIAQAVNTVVGQGVTYFSSAAQRERTTATCPTSAAASGTVTGAGCGHLPEL